MTNNTHISNPGLVHENPPLGSQELKPAGGVGDQKANSTNAQTDIDPQEVNYQPPHDKIALRAYELYIARGKQPGHESEDWEQARRELIESRK